MFFLTFQAQLYLSVNFIVLTAFVTENEAYVKHPCEMMERFKSTASVHKLV